MPETNARNSPISTGKLARNKPSRRQLWFERVMALLALTNLGLVLFDLSYIAWRDLYFREARVLTKVYDPVKGIEEHRDTQRYLKTVEQLKAQVQQTGLQSPEVEALLKELQGLSVEMVETNPFAQANKTGTLEKIKNRMRDRIDNDSAKQSFRTFWSQPYLAQQGWQKEIKFYDSKIQPLIAANYFRPIWENGEPIDYFFWRIDIWFFSLFAVEFLLRTYILHRRHGGISWLEAMLWRWYDILLLLPIFRWLRAIPVVIRLHQAEFLNLDTVRTQFNRGFVANFAGELAEIVVIRVINQVQGSIQRGEFVRWLTQRDQKEYVDINNINEVEAIAKLMMNLTVHQVMPKIMPDLEALLRHNIEKILNQSPIYQGLQNVPGLGHLPTQMTERLVAEISQGAYNTLIAALEDDPVGDEIFRGLVQHFSEAVGSEVQRQHTLPKLQSLLTDFLEEIKINYVERLSEEDLEQILEQTRSIRQIVKR